MNQNDETRVQQLTLNTAQSYIAINYKKTKNEEIAKRKKIFDDISFPKQQSMFLYNQQISHTQPIKNLPPVSQTHNMLSQTEEYQATKRRIVEQHPSHIQSLIPQKTRLGKESIKNIAHYVTSKNKNVTTDEKRKIMKLLDLHFNEESNYNFDNLSQNKQDIPPGSHFTGPKNKHLVQTDNLHIENKQIIPLQTQNPRTSKFLGTDNIFYTTDPNYHAKTLVSSQIRQRKRIFDNNTKF